MIPSFIYNRNQPKRDQFKEQQDNQQRLDQLKKEGKL